jgi:hypothetical protein
MRIYQSKACFVALGMFRLINSERIERIALEGWDDDRALYHTSSTPVTRAVHHSQPGSFPSHAVDHGLQRAPDVLPLGFELVFALVCGDPNLSLTSQYSRGRGTIGIVGRTCSAMVFQSSVVILV